MVKFKAFWQLVRWPNLVLIALVIVLIRYFIVIPLGCDYQLSTGFLILYIFSTLAVAASGYIINDIFDQNVDIINKPDKRVVGTVFTENQCWQMVLIANILAVAGFYFLSREARYSQLWYIPILVSIMLYFYSSYLKKMPLAGNLLISLFTALPILLVPVFDLLPAATNGNAALTKKVIEAVVAYGVFAMYANFIREIVKDAQDYQGDDAHGFNTLPILMGLRPARWVMMGLLLIMAMATSYFSYVLLTANDYISAVYVVLLVLAPQGWIMALLYKAQLPPDFKLPSLLLKIVMLTGILSMVVFTLSLKAMS